MIRLLHIDSLEISENRQRKHFDSAALDDLAKSISKTQLLHPLVVREGKTLIAGERRSIALRRLFDDGLEVRFNNETLPAYHVPVVDLGDLDPIQAKEAELEENITRADLTMQERAVAIKELHDLRCLQNPAQTVADTAEEVTGRRDGDYQANIRKQLIIAEHLHDPDVSKAKSINEAMKILKVKEERRTHELKGQALPSTIVAGTHQLFNCDFRDLPSLPLIDVLITDPPYGMGADSFASGGDSQIGIKAQVVGHAYEDSYETWNPLMDDFAKFSWACTKPQAHLYCFCDIDRFHELKAKFESVGWLVHRTPLIYFKSHAMSRRVPWPTSGPRRSYEILLYAIRGQKPVKHVVPDVFQATADDENLGHSAQKPVSVWENLLARSVSPGDIVADFFAGTGGLLEAAQNLKCTAIICERDPAHYSIIHGRLEKIQGASNDLAIGVAKTS